MVAMIIPAKLAQMDTAALAEHLTIEPHLVYREALRRISRAWNACERNRALPATKRKRADAPHLAEWDRCTAIVRGFYTLTVKVWP